MSLIQPGWRHFHDRVISRPNWQIEENRKRAAALNQARTILAEGRVQLRRIKQGLPTIEAERAKRRTERDRLLGDSSPSALERLEVIAKELQALDDAETFVQRQVASAESELVKQEAALQRAEASLERRRKELARLRRGKAGK